MTAVHHCKQVASRQRNAKDKSHKNIGEGFMGNIMKCATCIESTYCTCTFQVPPSSKVKQRNLCRLLLILNEITHNLCREANAISALLLSSEGQGHSEVIQQLPEDIQPLLNTITFDAKSLMHLSRMCIVKALAPNSHRTVCELPLPSAIKKYLLYRDIDEILLTSAGRSRGYDAITSADAVTQQFLEEDTYCCDNQGLETITMDEPHSSKILSKQEKILSKKERKKQRKLNEMKPVVPEPVIHIRKKNVVCLCSI